MRFDRVEKYRWQIPTHPVSKTGDDYGAFLVRRLGKPDIRIVANGEFAGWEHVSVSLSAGKMPTWTDMCFVKDLFWDPDDCVVQFHPPESEYVNMVDNCLHLWKYKGGDFPMPSSTFVGIKGMRFT